jgi:hypothetical protein
MEKRQLIEPGSIEQGIRDLSEGVRAMQRVGLCRVVGIAVSEVKS